jgi:hypothetical protein
VGLTLVELAQEPEPQELGERVAQVHDRADDHETQERDGEDDVGLDVARVGGSARRLVSDEGADHTHDHGDDGGRLEQAVAAAGPGDVEAGGLGLQTLDAIVHCSP